MRNLFITLLFAFALTATAQREPFDPERFETELLQYVSREAGFNTQEAQTFAAIHREMHAKQEVLFRRIRQYHHTQTSDAKRCRQIVQEVDKMDLELKQLQQTYHDKMLSKLPPEKVFLALKAEQRFHRKSFKKMARKQ